MSDVKEMSENPALVELLKETDRSSYDDVSKLCDVYNKAIIDLWDMVWSLSYFRFRSGLRKILSLNFSTEKLLVVMFSSFFFNVIIELYQIRINWINIHLFRLKCMGRLPSNLFHRWSTRSQLLVTTYLSILGVVS